MMGIIEALLWITFGLAIGIGWLVYKLCEVVLIPLLTASLELFAEICAAVFELLGQLCVTIEIRIRAWWRRLTARWRIRRVERQTLREMDAAYREHIERFEAFAAALEETESRTADRTAAVQPVVRSAVHRWFGI